MLPHLLAYCHISQIAIIDNQTPTKGTCMESKEKKRLYPGDVGYPGGIFHTTIYIGGKVKDVRTVKDSNGDVVCVTVTDKIIGIF